MECFSKTGEGPELLIGYAAQSLPPTVELRIAAHLEQCEDCRRMADAQRRVWNALEDLELAPVSPGFDRKVLDRIAADRGRAWYTRIFDAGIPWRHAVPVAAACVALLVALIVRSPTPERIPDSPSAAKHIDIEQVERALDDFDMLSQMGIVPSASARPHGPS